MEFLRCVNGGVVNEQGQAVFLRGVNIGGWLNLEHFLTGHPGAESGLRRTMAAHLGAERAGFFFDRLLHHFFGAEDVRFLRSQGVTAIRVPLNYRHFEADSAPFEYREEGFARLDRLLDWCEQYGLYVILDLHAAQGWQNGDWHCDNSSRHALLWSTRHAQDRFVALWAEIARRLRNRPAVAAYNLLNEPLTNAPFGRFGPDADYCPDWPALNSLYARTAAALRETDPARMLVLEGDYYSTLFDRLELPTGSNTIVSSHNYIEAAIASIAEYPVTLNGVHWDTAEVERQFTASTGFQFAQSHGAPLLVGEFGLSMEYPAPNVPIKVQVLADQFATYNRHGCHWSFWAYKGLGSMAWVQAHSESPYMRAVAPVLRAKEALGVDFGWLGAFPQPVQGQMEGLAAALQAQMPGLDGAANFRYLAQSAMSCYAAEQLQNLYAAQFVGKTETQIDELLASFALHNCVERVEMSAAIRAAVAPAF